uniref:Uncharacterized protein n=1 Tax=Arundo donax TaxID=35708 RepID=A0A0A9CDN1_ARUDO
MVKGKYYKQRFTISSQMLQQNKPQLPV